MNLKQVLAGGVLLLGMGASQVGFTHGMACKGDFDKYCKGVQGREAKKQCIAQNKSQFSADCQAMIAKKEKFRAACEGDRKKYCGQDQEGRWKGKSCLRDHVNELSSQCRSLVEEHFKS